MFGRVLKEELNQALIFINLNNKEFDLMSLNCIIK